MGRVYLKFEKNKWKTVEKTDFWIDKALLRRLDNLKMIQKQEWDGVFIIDGPERSGKSTLGMICGWYLSNCKLTANNFARGIKDAAKKIAELPNKSVLIMDEGSTIFSSKDSTNTAQKKLIKILDVVGQKNLFFIIILPCIFDLNKTIAVRRSKFLLHVYPDKETYKRGRYACWGENVKGKLYRIGKKNFDSYAYPKPERPGEYFDFKPPFYNEYLKEVKAISLKEVLDDAMGKDKPSPTLFNFKIEVCGRLKKKFPKITQETMAYIFEVSQRTISEWIYAYNRGVNEGLYSKNEGFIKEVEDKRELGTPLLKPL